MKGTERMIDILAGFAQRRGFAVALSTAAAAALAGAAAPAGAADPVAPVAQDSRREVRLGVYDPHGTFRDTPDVAIEHIFMPWQEVDWATLRAADQYAASRGRELLISVEPWSWSGDNSLMKETRAAAVPLGQFDAEIDAFCQVAGGLRSRVTIRWGHEMDDTADRYAWSDLPPDAYVNAYRYFVDQCRKSAPRALYMWSPKGEPNAASYYPGSQYVDSIGISVFGLQAYDRQELGGDRGFEDALRERYDRVADFGKPIVAAELGFSGDSDYLGVWAAQLACAGNDFPQLDGIVYFNDVETHPWPGAYGNPDWRVRPELLDHRCAEDDKRNLVVAGLSDVLLRSTTADAPAPHASEPLTTSSITSAAPVTEASPSYPEVDADDSVPMLAWELAALYGGKSWMWSEGAGYLAADRKFLAWSGSADAATLAVGRWHVTDRGRMCFKATWYTVGGSAPNTTCFSHRKIGSTILQKKEPDGQWYVFRSSEPTPDDEYGKLRNSDEVSATFGQVQRNLQIKF